MTPGNARICQDDRGTQGEEILRNGGTTANAGTLVGLPPAQPSSPPTELGAIKGLQRVWRVMAECV